MKQYRTFIIELKNGDVHIVQEVDDFHILKGSNPPESTTLYLSLKSGKILQYAMQNIEDYLISTKTFKII